VHAATAAFLEIDIAEDQCKRTSYITAL